MTMPGLQSVILQLVAPRDLPRRSRGRPTPQVNLSTCDRLLVLRTCCKLEENSLWFGTIGFPIVLHQLVGWRQPLPAGARALGHPEQLVWHLDHLHRCRGILVQAEKPVLDDSRVRHLRDGVQEVRLAWSLDTGASSEPKTKLIYHPEKML